MELRESDGLKWINRGVTTDDHLSFTGHEFNLIPVIRSLIDKDSWYINVGAHVGTWALRLAEHAQRVYAIEANPATFEILEQNIKNNNLENKVKAVQAAIWSIDDEFVEFVDAKGFESGGSTRLRVSNVNANYPTTTLDTLFPVGIQLNDTKIGFIQMDVEGAEAHVLSGAQAILAHDRPNLLIELHEGHVGTDANLRSQVYDILEAYNYSYYSVDVCPPEEHIIARPVEKLDEYTPELIEGTR